MKKFIAGVVFGILVLGVGVRLTGAQQSGTTQLAAHEVRQGDPLHMDVTVDKASNVNGGVNVIATPGGGGTGKISFAGTLYAGQIRCQNGVNGIVPLEAELGKWVISQITFRPDGSSEPTELTRRGDLSFQVVRHGDIIRPEAATVSDIR